MNHFFLGQIHCLSLEIKCCGFVFGMCRSLVLFNNCDFVEHFSLEVFYRERPVYIEGYFQFCFRLDIKGCRPNVLTNISGRNRSSSTAFQLLPQTSTNNRPELERRPSQTPISALKIVRSVSRESIRSVHHCTCPCLNAQVCQLFHNFYYDQQ